MSYLEKDQFESVKDQEFRHTHELIHIIARLLYFHTAKLFSLAINLALSYIIYDSNPKIDLRIQLKRIKGIS